MIPLSERGREFGEGERDQLKYYKQKYYKTQVNYQTRTTMTKEIPIGILFVIFVIVIFLCN